MEIVIKGSPNEIATLVVELQERQSQRCQITVNDISETGTGCVGSIEISDRYTESMGVI